MGEGLSYLSIAGALLIAMFALILWGISLPLVGVLKIITLGMNALVRISRKLLKWI